MSQVNYLDTSRCKVNSSTFLPLIWFQQLLSSPRSYSPYVWLTPVLFTLTVINNTLLLSQSLYTSRPILLLLLKPLRSHWNRGRPQETSIFPCPWPLFPIGSNSSQSVLLQTQLFFSTLFLAFFGSFYP